MGPLGLPGSVRRRRAAFTLVELLVAMMVTLILIFALAQAFALVGNAVARGRATIEIAGSLRSVANRLQADLDGITVPVRPWIDEDAGQGYFELLDGPSMDKDWNDSGLYAPFQSVTDTTLGDVDDVLAFTAYSKGSPFMGEVGGNVVQANAAEVVWWIQYDDLDGDDLYGVDEPFTVYRRAMLIRPDDGVVFARTGSNAYQTNQTGYALLAGEVRGFFNQNDISVRINWWVDAQGLNVQLIANSLADLTRRENRFAHLPIMSDRQGTLTQQYNPPALAAGGVYPYWPGKTFPFVMDLNRRSITSLYRSPKFGNDAGEDVMLTRALAFDVQVFDPDVPVLVGTNASEGLVPSDPAYFSFIANYPGTTASGALDNSNWPRPTTNIAGYGAFVDLGYLDGDTTVPRQRREQWFSTASTLLNYTAFSGPPVARSGLTSIVAWRTPTYSYDTWSTHYERNGVDEDNDSAADEGTDGFDNDTANGVDDPGERETSPPYPYPLRGVQVKIRGYEPDSRQVKQVTVVADFIPE